MIKQCWGIHDNGCTEPAMHGSLFCESCAKLYWEACDLAKDAAQRAQDGRQRVLGDDSGKCSENE